MDISLENITPLGDKLIRVEADKGATSSQSVREAIALALVKQVSVELLFNGRYYLIRAEGVYRDWKITVSDTNKSL